MKLAYRAFDKSGRMVSNTIEAATLEMATDDLRRRGLFVTEIGDESGSAAEPKGASSMPGSRSLRIGGGGRRLRNLAVFSRQLFVLVSGGTPVVPALAAIERQADDQGWRGVLTDVRSRVEEGSTLTAAMEEHPMEFDEICRSLISAGESSGALASMLERLAALVRSQLMLRSSIIGALVYPALLVCVGIGVLVLMMLFVLPRFAGLFDTLGAPIPPSTQLLMDVSGVIQVYWWAVLIGIAALALGLRAWLKSPGGRRVWQGAALRAPKIGGLVRSLATARVCRLLGTLMESHVPMLEALKLTRASAGNVYYQELITAAEERVTRGEPMSAAFDNPRLISPSVYEAIRSGETGGQVGKAMLHMADFMDEENQVVVKSLASIIEPLILIGLGLLVGFIAISMFMPLFDLAGAAGGGGVK